ncbi:response regulator transcription factor [Streptomyces sp. NPDC056188]|uniref:helix-turn-helix transcriptional regulator n=1 Tax=Streptomyces sp. NPDC056188 TaxID=3345740 RepID=UPI0035E27A77
MTPAPNGTAGRSGDRLTGFPPVPQPAPVTPYPADPADPAERQGPATWAVHLRSGAVVESNCLGLPLEHRILDYARSFSELGVSLLSFYWKDRKGVLGQILLELSPDGSWVNLGWNPAPAPGGLTVRELQVLTLMAAGLRNHEIAGRLSTSTRTVTTHIERILYKWNVRSRTAAAVIAVQRGWLILPIPGGTDDCDALQVALLRTSHTSVQRDLLHCRRA